MKKYETIQFTYEDIRCAVASHFGIDVPGIKMCGRWGYPVETCPKEDQPPSSLDEHRQQQMANANKP